MAINEAYRRLKASGWQGTGQVHPTDRVPTFEFGNAVAYRDKSGGHDWIVEFQDAGRGYRVDIDDPAGLADYVAGFDEFSDLPQVLHSADIHAADLVAEYGSEFGGRIERAVEIVKAGKASDTGYNTTYDGSAGLYGLRECDCKDAQYRAPRAKFGMACKHCLAQEIAARIEAAEFNTACNEWVEEQGRKRDAGESWGDSGGEVAAQQAAWEAANPDMEIMQPF